VAQKLARTLLFVLFLTLSLSLLGGSLLGTPPRSAPMEWTGPARGRAERQVFLGGGLSDEGVITFTTTVLASGHPGVVLLDSEKLGSPCKNFLAALRPERVIPVGSFPDGITELERKLNATVAPRIPWMRGPPIGLWNALFPRAERIVVCPAKSRRLLLQSACLAGSLHAPLYVLHGQSEEAVELARRVKVWRPRTVYAVGTTGKVCRGLNDLKLIRLADEEAVAGAYLRRLARKGPIRTLVVANPADTKDDLGGMSALAPWMAVQKRAALLLTNETGDNVKGVVRAALKNENLLRADSLLLLASLKAIPMERRPNPIPGDKDPYIEMEPLTPRGTEPFTFATGRLFHEDRAVVTLLAARQRLLKSSAGSERKALVVSNPAGGLPLLEAFSRNTALEFRNAGYQLTSFFGSEASKDALRKALPAQDIFLWEGHHSTLIKDYGVHEWTEPLRPALVFLQSCLALTEPKAQPFLQRGAIGVVGSSTRTYSGSGGACALAFFDALHYEHASLGGSLRHAKNFLLAYSLLKEKRLGADARKSGANLRASWAFTLWGDPTLQLPRPAALESHLPPVRHKVRGNTIVLTLPQKTHQKVVTAKYQAEMKANGRLAGLVREGDKDGLRLVPFVFAEVHLSKAPPGKTPRLQSRLPARRWVFCWDHRRKCGYLLVTPRTKDTAEIRFHVKWEARSAATMVNNSAVPETTNDLKR
jgi:hypothetical protein